MDSSAPLVVKQVVTRTIGGEVLLVPIGRDAVNMDRLFVLNRVGAFVWQHLDGARTRNDLCALVRAQFAADERAVEADVDHFLSELLQRGLVAASTPTSKS